MGFANNDKKIECIEIKVYQSAQHKSGETRLRLVSWVIDGKKTAPSLEKRAFILREYKGERQLQMSKAKGFNIDEVSFIGQNAAKIRDDMATFVSENPKPAATPVRRKEAQGGWDDEPATEEAFA